MLWNMMNALPLAKGYQKHLLRLCFKVTHHLHSLTHSLTHSLSRQHPANQTLLRIHANYSLATNNYRFSLCLYEQCYRQQSSDHLTCLCIACVYFNMASQKGAMNRNQLVLQVTQTSLSRIFIAAAAASFHCLGIWI